MVPGLAGKTRGYHYHPHFVEYILVVDGSGVLVTREDRDDPATERPVHLSKGVCTRTEIGTYHTIYAITDLTIVAMLTKQWDHSDPPIVRCAPPPGDPGIHGGPDNTN